MTIKELKPANDSRTPDSREAAAESQEVLSLERLASRQQAAMAKLKETNSALDTLLEETTSTVDECIAQSKKMTDEVKSQASEKAAAMLAEAQDEAETIISAADREGKTQSRAAMRKVGGLIEAARSSASHVPRPEREQLPLMTGEIWAALEASIEQALQSVLNDLDNMEQLETRSLEQEAKLSGGQGATKLALDDSRVDGDKEPGNKENALDALWQLGPTVPAIDPREAGRNRHQEISAQASVAGSDGLAMGGHIYSGNVTMVILLKNASETRYHLTPEQISHRIKNTPGGSVVGSVMQGKEYFIKAHFENPVSLYDLLDGVSEWEDFEHQSDKVKEYQKQHGSRLLPRHLKESKNAINSLVTL